MAPCRLGISYCCPSDGEYLHINNLRHVVFHNKLRHPLKQTNSMRKKGYDNGLENGISNCSGKSGRFIITPVLLKRLK